MPRKPLDPRTKAPELLGRWTQLAQGHLPFGAGCSCGLPVVTLRIADLERDLLDYLEAKHPSASRTASIEELLRAIARAPAPGHDALLAALERSLDSFDEFHGRNQGARPQ